MQRKPENIFDELLVIRCQKGDEKAFEIIVKRWNVRLIKFAYKQVRDMDVAKDISQESWATITKSIKKLNDPARFSSWAFRVTYSKSMDWLRKNQRTDSDQAEKLEYKEIEEEHNEEILLTLLKKAIRELPDKQRVVLDFFYTEGYNIFQIGEILKIPYGTVKSRLFKAREHLKRLIKQHSHEYENG
ncbi:MAG: RNA polymerase sigma factor [Bacteroidota bacterium]